MMIIYILLKMKTSDPIINTS